MLTHECKGNASYKHLSIKHILSSAVISGSNYLSIMFFQQRLVELGYPTSLLFLPLLFSNLAAMLGTEWGRRIHLHSFRRFYTLCALLCGIGCLCVGAAPALVGILGCMLAEGVLGAWLLRENRLLNDAIPSDQRATLISMDNIAYSLLMIPASPLVGAIGDIFGQAGSEHMHRKHLLHLGQSQIREAL